MLSTNRFTAHLAVVLAALCGGGSLLLFGVFLIAGSFTAVPLDISEPMALLWDGFLSAVFFLQHSGMRRSSFRRWLSSRIPSRYYSATYAIVSGLVLTAVLLLWQRSHTAFFETQGLLQILLRTPFLLAIAGFAWSVWALRPFDPFGQISLLTHLEDEQLAPHLVIRGPYLWVRHPQYLFTLGLIWATPSLSLDRLLFNVLWTFWIVVGAHLEERDLVAQFGESYRRYQGTVPMFFPWKGRAGMVFERPE